MTPPTFVTLGPSGTCHENALLHYLEFQGLGADARVVLVDDLLEEGLELVRSRPNTFLVQCSAHVQVHLVTERYHEEVFVIDTFLYPTKELALLVRAGVEQPKSLGIVSATRGYVDLDRWRQVIDEPSKPVVARKLLAGEYESGLTHLHHAEEHPERLRVQEVYGAVDTTWVVYGPRKRFDGKVIAQYVPWLFTGEAAVLKSQKQSPVFPLRFGGRLCMVRADPISRTWGVGLRDISRRVGSQDGWAVAPFGCRKWVSRRMIRGDLGPSMRTSRGTTRNRRPDVSRACYSPKWETALDSCVVCDEDVLRVVGRAMA